MILKLLALLVPRRAQPPEGYPVRGTLLALVFACVIPAAIVSIVSVNERYRLEQERITRETVLLARDRVARLDQELSAVQSSLWALSISPSLVNGDLAEFHTLAREALKHQFATNYVLTDKDGRQLLNTLLPFGETLPNFGTPPELQGVFTSGNAVLTDLFYGAVTKQPMIAMGVPVYKGKDVVFSLNTAITSAKINAILSANPAPKGWVVAILDGKGTFIARTPDAERYVGQQAVPDLVQQALSNKKEGTLETATREGIVVLSAYSRSSLSDWSVAVGAPKQSLRDELHRSIALAAVGSALLLGLALWLAMAVSRRVADAVCGLVDPALALGRGEAVIEYRSWMKEANDVGHALVGASEMLLHAQHLAHHDPLTGLSNRALFDELLAQQLLHARRTHGCLAILAVDLDGFKCVNDTYGHAAGDQVLKIAAQRILGALRDSDVAARLGGDEFAVLLIGDMDTARIVATKLVEALSAPYPNVRPTVTASIGIAVYPQSGKDASVLLKRADAALYAAKTAGKRRVAIDTAAAPSDR